MAEYFDYTTTGKTVFGFTIGDLNYSIITDDDTTDEVVAANMNTISDCLSASIQILEEENDLESPELTVGDIADVVLDTIFKVTGISFKIIGVGPVILEISLGDD
jgi:lipoate-protein ligase A